MIKKSVLNKKLISNISTIKEEPSWMLKNRLIAHNFFLSLANPKWGPDLSSLNFEQCIYYKKNNKPLEKINSKLQKLNVPININNNVIGINNQYDSESICHKLQNSLEKKGVIFTSMDDAIKKYPNIVKKYFGKLVSCRDNKYSALNTAVWSGGSFLYVPKNIKLKTPLQSYFRIGTKSIGQFERTLIIIEENSKTEYIEGCTALTNSSNNLHAAVVEIFIGKNASCKYSTIQNWSSNVINLVTKRAVVEENGKMEWIDGNFGSKINMKYPCTILRGKNSNARCVSIAVARDEGIVHDTGAKMIHIGKNTKSQIISKSISCNGGNSTYRGLVKITNSASNSCSNVDCETLIIDKKSKSDTYPREIIKNNSSSIKHEAKITNFDKEKIFSLNCKGINNKVAKDLIISGFIEPFSKELPIEYAVELNRLLKEN